MSHSDTDTPYEFAAHHDEAEGKKVRRMVWNMFWVLLAITTVEVGLGMTWKEMGLNWTLIKTTFLVLTIAKAYFIVAYYMHLKHEWKGLQITVLVPYIVFASYLIFILLVEGMYHESMLTFFIP